MSTSIRPDQTTVFRRAWGFTAVAVVAAGGAIVAYPGGTHLDRSTTRYWFTQNFFSDLGMTVAYNNQSNRLGASLFVVALLSLVIGFGSALRQFVRLYSSTPKGRLAARGAAVIGLLVCLCFVGVAATPENSAFPAHL